MTWATLKAMVHGDFDNWCKERCLQPNVNNMFEFLGASGYLKLNKMSRDYDEDSRETFFLDMCSWKEPMREGMLPPSATIKPKKGAKKK